MGWNYWNQFPKRRRKINYTLRFKIAFPDVDSFVKCFPEETKQVATDNYEMLFLKFGNIYLVAQTAEENQGELMYQAKSFLKMYLYYVELSKKKPEDFFINNRITDFNNDQEATGHYSNKSENNSSSKGTTKDYVTNQSEKDDAALLNNRHMTDAETTDGSGKSNGNGEGDSNSTGKNTGHETQKTTKYDVNDYIALKDLVGVSPEMWYLSKIMDRLVNPIQNYRGYDDWEGDKF